jgi:hypothetical protein
LHGIEPRGALGSEFALPDRFNHRAVVIAVITAARAILGDFGEIGEGGENGFWFDVPEPE